MASHWRNCSQRSNKIHSRTLPDLSTGVQVPKVTPHRSSRPRCANWITSKGSSSSDRPWGARNLSKRTNLRPCTMNKNRARLRIHSIKRVLRCLRSTLMDTERSTVISTTLDVLHVVIQLAKLAYAKASLTSRPMLRITSSTPATTNVNAPPSPSSFLMGLKPSVATTRSIQWFPMNKWISKTPYSATKAWKWCLRWDRQFKSQGAASMLRRAENFKTRWPRNLWPNCRRRTEIWPSLRPLVIRETRIGTIWSH